MDTPTTVAFSDFTMKESDFAWKEYVDVPIKDLDLHDIIDLKTYRHVFQSTLPEDFTFDEIDDFWDLNNQCFIFKTPYGFPPLTWQYVT